MSKRKKKSDIEVDFPGFGHHKAPDQFFKYPMILEDYWHVMTGSEQKVLTFILRKTYGWQQNSDSISLSQFTDGDGTGDGTGLSRIQVRRAIDELERKGFIKVTRYNRKPSYFELPLNEQALTAEKNGVFDDIIKTRIFQKMDNDDYMEQVNWGKNIHL